MNPKKMYQHKHLIAIKAAHQTDVSACTGACSGAPPTCAKHAQINVDGHIKKGKLADRLVGQKYDDALHDLTEILGEEKNQELASFLHTLPQHRKGEHDDGDDDADPSMI